MKSFQILVNFEVSVNLNEKLRKKDFNRRYTNCTETSKQKQFTVTILVEVPLTQNVNFPPSALAVSCSFISH